MVFAVSFFVTIVNKKRLIFIPTKRVMFLYLRLIKESFYFAINALRNNKLRTFLSLLGVTVGIFSIIAVLAAVDSLDRQIKDQLSGLDKNTMYLAKFSFGPTDSAEMEEAEFS